MAPPDDAAVVALPTVPAVGDVEPDESGPDDDTADVGEMSGAASKATAAVIDSDGQLGVVVDGRVGDDWAKFRAHASPDRTTAVMTVPPEIAGASARPVVWVDLPDGRPVGEQVMGSGSELTATSLDGTFAGLTTFAGDPIDGALAGARTTSEIEILSRDDGSVFRQRLDGNFAPEAFSSRLTADGIPALVFLLEYFPADVPRFYRVRVLSTETGEVSLPLNLRNKVEQVDERMAGFSRSQVVAEDDGLLFTLYRGTIDGTPDGEPYAFVHTLDFGDGVWCLDVDPRLELDRLAGSLAVGGDRLYVASANGMVGSFEIPSIDDPTRSPTMEWVVQAVAPTDGSAPLIAADDSAVYVVDPGRAGFVAHIHPDGLLHPSVGVFGGDPTAVELTGSELQAVGDHWSSFGDFDRPAWLDDVVQLFVAEQPD